ncbi:MAG: SPOR domain-containing protein [Sphingomonadaceae bacterium]
MTFRFGTTARQRQQGNTFVGIIIGLVIGLVIAVIVALAITKGATPFTDKSGKSNKSTEPTAGQVADPNKPMYGNKEAAREAAKDFAKEPKPVAAPPADPLQAVVDKIQGPAEKAKPAAVAAAAPAAATPSAANVAPAKPAADAGSDEKYIYYLQAGAFREIADAESARAKLALLGFEANVSDRATDTGVLHRVRLGPFQQVEAMNRVRSKLSENGVDVAVVRNQK